MKNSYALILIAFFSWPLAQGFQDLPALTNSELSLKRVSKIVGGAAGVGAGAITEGVVGAVAGGVVGGFTGAVGAQASHMYEKKNKEISSSEVLKQGFIRSAVPAAAVGGAYGIFRGGMGGYQKGARAGQAIATRYLAKYHGVLPRVEMVSQFYDINIGQYGSLLIAAEKKVSIEYLNQLINQIYTQRFGQDWKKRLIHLQTIYRDLIQRFGARKEDLDTDGKDFLRMMELGAAMQNLYFKTSPDARFIIPSAIVMYNKLGLL